MNDSTNQAIRIHVDEVSQLFNSLDPFPFHQRDLDADAEEFIVSWARDLLGQAPLKIVVHLPRAQMEMPATRGVEEALRRFFAYRADVVGRDLQELFRVGRLSLAIGLAVLGMCLFAGHFITGRFGAGYLGRFLEEGLIIVGWVANWKPLEIFLYDWWPLARRRDLYRRLARAEVTVSADPE